MFLVSLFVQSVSYILIVFDSLIQVEQKFSFLNAEQDFAFKKDTKRYKR